MFYTRGCRHTKILFDPDQADSFRHGYPNHLPDHLFPQLTFIRENTALSVDLLSAKVPPIVHFIWCDKDYFQFQNYLSVLSAFKFLKPTGIYFHYMQIPELDSDGYYQFFMDLKQDIPGLILQPLKSSHPCSGNHASKMNFVLELLNAQGGIFMSENTILADSLSNLRKKSVMYAVVGMEPVMVLMERGFLDSYNVDSADLLSDESKRFSCPENSSFRLGSQMYCTFVKTQIFPVTVFELKSDFGQLARWVAYGKADILRPSPANETVIPNIVHYVWLGERSLNYFAFLSLLSSLYVLNAEMVYIHGNFEPTGPHWDKIKHHIRVQFVLRDFPETVFDQSIKFASHGSDYLRSDLLIRYGGIYTDWDVLWVHPIPDRLRQYELVACPDFPATGAFPDVFNMGVLLAAKGARFMRYFLESYHHYLNNHWSYNAIHMPYKVYEKHPDLLLVDRHLQVYYLLSCIFNASIMTYSVKITHY